MSEPQLAFEMLPAVTADDVRSHLSPHVALQLGPPTAVERVYYDTFDWRLYRAGLALVHECASVDAAAWRLYELGTGETVASQESAVSDTAPCDTRNPFFATDLPEGPLVAALEPITSIRALLPLAHVVGTVSTLRVFNKNIKTVVRVAIENTRPSNNDSPLPAVVRLLPVRGYDRRLDEVQSLLAEMPGLLPGPDDPLAFDPMVLAATAAGHPPGDYVSSLKIPLSPTDRADDATRAIHRTLFDAMVRNEPGVRADIDSEFLHDYRVAVRRTRSALSQIRDVLPGQKIEHFKEEFGWLGEMTGPTRDLDVYLLQFDDFRDQLPEHMRDRLDPLQEHLARRQKEEQAILVKALSTARYRKLLRDWPAYLEKPTPPRNPPPNAELPILALANRQIWRAYRRVAREASAVTPTSPAEMVHEVRKSAKKLRYLMEFYAALYPAADFKTLVIELKQLQDVLGEYQDLQVQIDSLEGYAAEMQALGIVPAATLMAIGALTGQLYARELEVREELTPFLERFARPRLRRRFALLFDQPVPDEDEADDKLPAADETANEPEAGS